MPRKTGTANKADAPIIENESVKELLAILKENGKDASFLLSVINSVTSMEKQLSEAVKGFDAVQRELSAMREERDHPVKTMMEKTSRSLSANIKGIAARVKIIKDSIVNGCKRAVEAFKDKGASALNNLAEFFDIKQNLLSERDSINACIEQAHKSITKIEAASAEAHAAGRSIKNIGRAMQGKEPIPDIKPNGKLARLIETPYRNEIRSLNRSLRSVNKTLASLDRLEKAAAKSAETERPSTRDTMQRLQREIDAERQDTPTRVRTLKKETEVS